MTHSTDATDTTDRSDRSDPTDPTATVPDPDAEDVTDSELVAAVARVVARPIVEPADSFVLHAPLELLARSGPLRPARPGARPAAGRRLAALAEQYRAVGTPLPDPEPQTFPSAAAAAGALVDAIGAGDLDAADRAAS